jgi:antitoxin component YwqK of YwqJK toxin-antitoxin module
MQLNQAFIVGLWSHVLILGALSHALIIGRLIGEPGPVVIGRPASVVAAGFVCPAGTRFRSLHQHGDEEWCERSDGTKHGRYRSRSSVGLEEGEYVDGERDGLWLSRRDARIGSTDPTTEEVHYRRGVPHGMSTSRYDGGALCAQGENRNGEKHGTWRGWYRDGTPRSIESYVDGVEQGHMTEWDEQGRVVVDGDYDAGKRTGPWLLGYEGGTFDAGRGRFCADKPCGPWQYFREGQLAVAGSYRDGRRDGVWKGWFEGQLYRLGSYSSGLKNGRWTKWLLGTSYKVYEIDCRNGVPQGSYRQWWDSGKLLRSGHYLAGVADGAWREYDDDGKLTGAASFRRGELVPGSYRSIYSFATELDTEDNRAADLCDRGLDADDEWDLGDNGEDGDQGAHGRFITPDDADGRFDSDHGARDDANHR